MKHVVGLTVVIFVGILAWRVGGNMSSNSLSMAVGVLFGMLAGIPTALLVGVSTQLPKEPTHHHHTHDVAVRFIPQQVRTVMAQHGADDAVRINGQWVLLDGDRIVARQRLLAG